MITVGDFIVSRGLILYFVKLQIQTHNNAFILMPVCSVENDKFKEEFVGCIVNSDRIVTINDIINMNYIHNHELMNKAMEYLIERHRL